MYEGCGENHLYMRCAKCGMCMDGRDGRPIVLVSEIAEDQREGWLCPECAQPDYGLDFLNWVKNRISASNSEDSTGLFVVRELVQNADDVEATLMVIRFQNDALYVYNDGVAFRDRMEDGGPGDFERISRVLARPKEEDPYTTGNFGSGFQTVYLFTNFPEAHSAGKAFRFDPTVPKTIPIPDERLKSLYAPRGAIFRFPWRMGPYVDEDGREFFNDDVDVWKRWDEEAQRNLYKRIKGYLHDVILACQHLKIIRVIWRDKEGHQVERDFTLSYVDNDGKAVTVKEGLGSPSGPESPIGVKKEDWEYLETPKEYHYMVGSDFVRETYSDDSDDILIISKGKGHGRELRTVRRPKDKEDYYSILKTEGALKKSDIHILIPLFPVSERKTEEDESKKSDTHIPPLLYEKKTAKSFYVYSVVPLPKHTRNNFVFSAHLFPKEDRGQFEGHMEPEKGEWLKKVLDSAVELYVRTYSKFVEKVIEEDGDWKYKQKMILDQIANPDIWSWVGLSSPENDYFKDKKEEIVRAIVRGVFSQRIVHIPHEGRWEAPISFTEDGDMDKDESILIPRTETERWLMEQMEFYTYNDGFWEHERIRMLYEEHEELKELKMEDEDFLKSFGRSMEDEDSFFADHAEEDENGDYVLLYPKMVNREFVEKLIRHCLIGEGEYSPTDGMKKVTSIPNAEGIMKRPKDLHIAPSNLPDELVPPHMDIHPDFKGLVAGIPNLLEELDLDGLLEGMSTDGAYNILVNDRNLLYRVYDELEKKIRTGHRKIPIQEAKDNGWKIVLTHEGELLPLDKVRWVPDEGHYETLIDYIHDSNIGLVDKDVLYRFEGLIKDEMKVGMFDYIDFLKENTEHIENNPRLQNIVAKGILYMISEGKTRRISISARDVMDLKFIPSSGNLNRPKDVCLGSTEDEEVDGFLGCVDSELQSRIEEKGLMEILKKDLNVVDLRDFNEDMAEYIAKKIDALGGENAELSDEMHRIVSFLVVLLAEKERIGGFNIAKYSFLPVQLHGKIRLSQPPRWDLPEKKKWNKTRIEPYEREWPWIRPKKEYMYEDLYLLWDSIRFLRLHDDFKEREMEIGGQLKMETPITESNEKGLRGLVIKFIFPKRTKGVGLFDEDEIRRFVGIHDKDDIDMFKKSMLHYVKLYYSVGKHEDETEPHEYRCLYDSDNIWRKPGEMMLNITDLARKMGYHELHPDFSEDNGWTTEILLNLRVAKAISLKDLKEKVEESLAKDDRETLEECLCSLASGGIEGIGEDNKHVMENLKRMRWVPCMDGRLRCPPETLFLEEWEKESLFGDYKVGRLIDLEVCGNSTVDVDVESLTAIGVSRKPSFEDMVKVWDFHAEKGISPPPNLFKRISEELSKGGAEVKSDGRIRKVFIGGKWIDSKNVFIKRRGLPEALKERYVILEESAIPRSLLSFAKNGGRTEISIPEVIDTLIWLGERKDYEVANSLWVYLNALMNDATEEEIEESRNILVERDGEICPWKGRFFSPSRIFIGEGDDNPPFSLQLGNILILTEEDAENTKNPLSKLGAESLEHILESVKEVERSGILVELRNSIESRGSVPDTEDGQLDMYLFMLARLLDNEEGDHLRGKKVIPIRKGSKVSFHRSDEVLIPDHPHSNLFEDDVLFFDRSILERWLEPKRVEEVLEDLGIEPISHYIHEEDLQKEEMPDEELTEAFRRLAAGLSMNGDFEMLLRAIWEEGPGFFNGLRDFSIYRGDIQHMVFLEIPGSTIDANPQSSSTEFIKDWENRKIILEDGVDMSPQDLLVRIIQDAVPDEEIVENVRSLLNMASKKLDAQNEDMKHKGRPSEEEIFKTAERKWEEYLQRKGGEKGLYDMDVPMLTAGIWWRVMGMGGDVDYHRRDRLLAERIAAKDRRTFFKIFAMATLFDSGIKRKTIKNFIDRLERKGLSLGRMWDMKAGEILHMVVDDVLSPRRGSEVDSPEYPSLRRRILDIIIIKEAMSKEDIGGRFVDDLFDLMKDGRDPSGYITKNKMYDERPFFGGFYGMFNRQIYFFVREMVRLGRKFPELIPSRRWDNIAFYLPARLESALKENGVDLPEEDRRKVEHMRFVTRNIGTLGDWYDIPFFVALDMGWI